MTNCDLSVLIPVYNEEFRLDITFKEILKFSQTTGLTVEYIFINDGSVDGTIGRISHFISNNNDQKMKLLSYANNKGKGFAFRKGVEAAKGKWILLADADFSTPLHEVYPMLRKCQSGYDLVYGSRVCGHCSLLRKLISALFIKLRALFLPQLNDIVDTQCGFKLLSNSAAKLYSAKGTINGFLFDMELILFLKNRGATITGRKVQWIFVKGSHLISLKNIGKTLSEFIQLTLFQIKEKSGINKAIPVQSIVRSPKCHS